MKKNTNITTKTLKPSKAKVQAEKYNALEFITARFLKSVMKFPPLNWLVN
jgi:hypothetical protein